MVFSKKDKPICSLLVALLLWITWGCGVQVQTATQKDQTKNTSSPHEKPGTASPQPPPHAVASLQLTEHGCRLLENKKIDDAIRLFERAIGLNPQNGENYYYLAEGWLAKGRLQQAREFSRLAVLYLGDNPQWKDKVRTQTETILEALKMLEKR